MVKVKYNKAVRDRIPEIIEKSGRKCDFKTLSDGEFLVELEKKLSEELQEYQESKNVEELADIMEVIYRIAELHGINPETLDGLRNKKKSEKGAFTKNLFLVDTD